MTSVRLLCLEIRATQKDCVLFVTQYSSVTQNSFLLVQSIVPSQSHSYASFLSITISTEEIPLMIAYEQQLIMAPPKLGGGTYDTVRVSSPSLGTGTTDSTTVIPWCAKQTLMYYQRKL